MEEYLVVHGLIYLMEMVVSVKDAKYNTVIK
jgi:hypothetical protein